MKKILVVEDDLFLSNAYRVKLTKEGFDVRMTGDGEAAMAALTEFTPDIILLDLMMPKKDGFTVLEELKKHPVFKNIPVIIASNLSQKEDIEKAKVLGAAEFVVKTETPLSVLIEKINTLTQK